MHNPKITDTFSDDTRPVRSSNDFIWHKDASLSPEFCKHIIDRFNSDGRSHPGKVGDGKFLDTVKQTTDMHISQYDDYKKEDAGFYKALKEGVVEYYQHIFDITDGFLDLTQFNDYEFKDSGYQIQRYEPGGFYRWHHDYKIEFRMGARVFTFMWYLNTVDEGGCTEFIDGSSIKPEVGRLVIFPGTWTYMHRACPPIDQEKYICTGWIYTKPYSEAIKDETSKSDT